MPDGMGALNDKMGVELVEVSAERVVATMPVEALLGVRFMLQAGYQPEELIGVMQILAEVSGGSRGSDFFSTHPAPENRMEKIREVIARERAAVR